MNENTKILLNKARSAEAVNKNTTFDFNIQNTNKPLPLNDIDTTLSQYEQILKERKASTIYRFYGEINCIVSNPLYNENIKIAIDENNVNNIIAASLTNFETQPKNKPRVLAAALTEGEYQVQIGTREVPLRPTTGKLVENLAQTIPGSLRLVNS